MAPDLIRTVNAWADFFVAYLRWYEETYEQSY